jgi:hypothetical protein
MLDQGSRSPLQVFSWDNAAVVRPTSFTDEQATMLHYPLYTEFAAAIPEEVEPIRRHWAQARGHARLS